MVLALDLFLHHDYLEGKLLRQKARFQLQFLFDAVDMGCGPSFEFCVWYMPGYLLMWQPGVRGLSYWSHLVLRQAFSLISVRLTGL